MKKMVTYFFVLVFLFYNSLAIAGVELNTASYEELKTLHGVGPVRAMEIIKYREQNGGFKSIDELKNVKGIGEINFEDLRGDISVWEPYWKPYK